MCMLLRLAQPLWGGCGASPPGGLTGDRRVLPARSLPLRSAVVRLWSTNCSSAALVFYCSILMCYWYGVD